MKPLFLLTLLLCLLGCNATTPGIVIPADTNQTDTTHSDAPASDAAGRAATVLSAFFGLDNGLPLGANARLCFGAGNDDGMPVIFSEEVNTATVQAGDFQVTTRDGTIGFIQCVTMAPAVDSGELRTALLVGEYGSAAENPPVTVEIVGNLLTMDNTLNFKGSVIDVTPLEPGPTLIAAEVVPESQWDLGKGGGPWGTGGGCPEGTQQVVRVIWAGGVTKSAGGEADDVERALYSVTVANESGTTRMITPFALADLGDGDNNHELCLDSTNTPISVAFPAGFLADPNGDLNTDTEIEVGR